MILSLPLKAALRVNCQIRKLQESIPKYLNGGRAGVTRAEQNPLCGQFALQLVAQQDDLCH